MSDIILCNIKLSLLTSFNALYCKVSKNYVNKEVQGSRQITVTNQIKRNHLLLS